jgi:hypothetical protein
MAVKETLMNKFYGDKFVYLKRGQACLNNCKVKKAMIGSVSCRACENVIEMAVSPKGYDYIVCSKIDEALGEFSPAVVEKNKLHDKKNSK